MGFDNLVDLGHDADGLAEGDDDLLVVVGEFRTALGRDLRPVTTLGQFDSPLIGHIDKQQIGNLLDVIAVIDPVMPQGMTESPEFLHYVRHEFTPELFSH